MLASIRHLLADMRRRGGGGRSQTIDAQQKRYDVGARARRPGITT